MKCNGSGCEFGGAVFNEETALPTRRLMVKGRVQTKRGRIPPPRLCLVAAGPSPAPLLGTLKAVQGCNTRHATSFAAAGFWVLFCPGYEKPTFGLDAA